MTTNLTKADFYNSGTLTKCAQSAFVCWKEDKIKELKRCDSKTRNKPGTEDYREPNRMRAGYDISEACIETLIDHLATCKTRTDQLQLMRDVMDDAYYDVLHTGEPIEALETLHAFYENLTIELDKAAATPANPADALRALELVEHIADMQEIGDLQYKSCYALSFLNTAHDIAAQDKDYFESPYVWAAKEFQSRNPNIKEIGPEHDQDIAELVDERISLLLNDYLEPMGLVHDDDDTVLRPEYAVFVEDALRMVAEHEALPDRTAQTIAEAGPTPLAKRVKPRSLRPANDTEITDHPTMAAFDAAAWEPTKVRKKPRADNDNQKPSDPEIAAQLKMVRHPAIQEKARNLLSGVFAASPAATSHEEEDARLIAAEGAMAEKHRAMQEATSSLGV